MTREGFDVVLREDDTPRRSCLQLLGLLYGAACKALRMEKAFPHGNPYHRHAFPVAWWQHVCKGADIAVVNYSYWAWIPTPCPKVLVLLDLWSDHMWGGTALETREIAACRHVFAISLSEVERLRERGVQSVSWSPPAIPASVFPLPPSCGLIGSRNAFNVEGLRWLESAGATLNGTGIRVYGALADAVRHPALARVGRYIDSEQPYRDNGIVLFTTVQGMGVQIKTIEALAAGRAIIARRGAVRGMPPNDGTWVEVETPQGMMDAAARLIRDATARTDLSARARAYYDRYLDSDRIRRHVAETVQRLGAAPA